MSQLIEKAALFMENNTSDDNWRLNVMQIPNKNRFKVSEKIRFEIKANNSGYLYIFAKNANNKSILVYPNMSEPKNNFFQAEQKIVMPRDGSGWEMEISEPCGTEKLAIVFSGKPIIDETMLEKFLAKQDNFAFCDVTNKIESIFQPLANQKFAESDNLAGSKIAIVGTKSKWTKFVVEYVVEK